MCFGRSTHCIAFTQFGSSKCLQYLFAVEAESPTLGEDFSSEDILSSPSTAQDVSQKKLGGHATDDSIQAPSCKIDPHIHAEGLQSEVPSLEYLGAPLPRNEEQRYEALCGLEVLDTATQPDERFDDITKLVSLSVLRRISCN